MIFLFARIRPRWDFCADWGGVLVSGVKIRLANDQYLHLADRPVNDPRGDRNQGQWPNQVPDAVQLDGGPGIAFQDDVNLRVLAMMMRDGGTRDFC